MRTTVRGVPAAVLALALAVPLTGAAAGTDLPPLRVSPDGGSFTVGGQAFLWLGDSAWGLLTDLDRAGVQRYLDMRADQGFTVVQTVVPAAPNVYGDAPSGVTAGSDPADPAAYDYWDHVDFVVSEAARRGVRVALAPAWSGLVSEDARGFGEFLGARYGSDVVWMLGSDEAAESSPSAWRGLADGISLGSGAANSDLLMTYVPGSGQTSEELYGDAEWLSFSLFRSGLCEDGVESLARVAGGRPYLDAQPSYEDVPDCAGPGRSDALDIRRNAYADVFAGAAGHTYGEDWPWREAHADEGADGMRHLRALFESRPLLGRTATPEALTTGPEGVRALRTADGGSLLVHSPDGEPFGLDTTGLAGGALRGWWFDPRTGTPIDAGTVARGRSVAFYPPTTGPGDAGLDWVLVVDDTTRGLAPPGTPLPS
ncbi:DUF4038 domain-containing protein [Pseudonocardia sp.]|uniref:apiosidase-like domain-containing protein n=1 Tax=Pseudonocardia sp. TaxID=60912 RepID=UPI0026338DC2|nr:DUF4038 domain-containing protein [Pseudonocardia sp.]